MMSHPNQTLVAYLSNHDVPCTGCGYNLRGSASSSCPECGTPVQITDGSTNRTVSVITLLYWCAAWLGGQGFFFGMFVGFSPTRLWDAWQQLDLNTAQLIFVPLGAIVLPISVLLLLVHRWVVRWRTRWLIVWVVPVTLAWGVGMLCLFQLNA